MIKAVVEHWLAAGLIVLYWYNPDLAWIGLFLFMLLVEIR